MLKLMKYEFRKSMVAKLILIAAVLVGEAVFVYGCIREKTDFVIGGAAALFFIMLFGLMYLGIQGIVTLHKDLNTKQSYMLFLTPKTSFQILGAKMLENALTILLIGAAMAGLIILDFSMTAKYVGGFEELIRMLNSFLTINVSFTITAKDVILTMVPFLTSWLLMVMTGFFAVILTATFLNGKKFSGLIAIILYFILNYAFSKFTTIVTKSMTGQTEATAQILISVAISVVVYVISGWIMEKKLSV